LPGLALAGKLLLFPLSYSHQSTKKELNPRLACKLKRLERGTILIFRDLRRIPYKLEVLIFSPPELKRGVGIEPTAFLFRERVNQFVSPYDESTELNITRVQP